MPPIEHFHCNPEKGCDGITIGDDRRNPLQGCEQTTRAANPRVSKAKPWARIRQRFQRSETLGVETIVTLPTSGLALKR